MKSRIYARKKSTREQTQDFSTAPAQSMFQPRPFVVQPRSATKPQQQPDLKTSLMRAQRYGHHLHKMHPAGQPSTQAVQSMQLVKQEAPQGLQTKLKNRLWPRKTNNEKIELLQHKLRTLQQAQQRAKEMEIYFPDSLPIDVGATPQAWQKRKNATLVKSIESDILSAKLAVERELEARGAGIGKRSKAGLTDLRGDNPELYGEHHKIANVTIQQIIQKLDKLENEVVKTPEQAVDRFNRVSRANQANNIEARVEEEGTQIRVGQRIVIEVLPSYHSILSEDQNKTRQQAALEALRSIRKIIQTPVGLELIGKIEALQSQVTIQYEPGRLAQSSLGQTQGHGAKRGKPSQVEGAIGTGQPSNSLVRFDPNTKIPTIGTDRPGKPAAEESLPVDAALFHELTHALHAAQGTQDVTRLKQRDQNPAENNIPENERKGDLYTKGAWVNQEEKNTVMAERKYLEQIGFPLKRIMYGLLADRIDK